MSSASQKSSVKPAPFPDLSPMNSPITQSKRRLEDDNEVPSSLRPQKIMKTYAPYQKHETHWYLDGNLLLQVGTTRFKVHRSRLASESEWFQALIDYWDGTTPEGREVPEDVRPIADAGDTIGDDPLFFLDAEEGKEVPGAEELAALLTAMYRGIDYVFDLPTVDEIRLLYGAAYHYDVTRYETFAMKYMERLLPEFSKAVHEPSLPNAVHGIHIGKKFKAPKIYARALFDLARASTLSLEQCLPPKALELNGTAAISPGPGAAPANRGADGASSAVVDGPIALTLDDQVEWEKNSKNILKGLSPIDFIRIIVLQRHLAGVWDDITKDIISSLCSVLTCSHPLSGSRESSFNSISLAKAKFPCDPLLGIDDLRKNIQNFPHYCNHMKTTIIPTLERRKVEMCRLIEEQWTK